MGIWSGLKSLCKKAYNGVKTVTKATYEGAKTVTKAVYNGVSNMAGSAGRFIKEKIIDPAFEILDKFTGKAKFDEAKSRYEKLTTKYNEKKTAYESQISTFSKEINNLVENVNSEKQYVINTLFVKMNSVLSKIKYEKKFKLEYFRMPSTMVEPLRVRDELFLIDFDKDKVKSYLKAFLTAGFWSRKDATETLDRIIEEEKKTEEIFAKMDAELARLRLLKDALAQTLSYLKDMSAMYENVIYKAHNTAKYLRFKCMQFTHGISMEYCKLESLPKADRELMFALFNFTKILDDIVKMEFVGQDTDEITRYEMNLKKCKFEFNKARETIAA